MTKRHHQDWLESYVGLFNGRTEAPTKLHRWTGFSVLAGACTRRVWIDEVIFRYYPNQYIVFVSPPGISTKSTAIGLGINLLKELDHIYLAADNTTYPAFIQDLAKHSSELRDEVSTTGDATDDLWIKQCAVTAAISEFGTFFKPEDEDMVNGLTDLWDCRSILVKDTKHNGTDVVEHPFVNLIAGTTTHWVQQKLKAQIGGWGLSSRIIFVFNDVKARHVARPSKMWAAGEYERATRTLVEDLRHIADLNGPFIFSDAADALWSSWYEEAGERLVEHNRQSDPDAWVGHFLARKAAHVSKLAMLLSVARSDRLVIDEVDLQRAVQQVDEVQEEIPRIFKLLAEPTPLARAEQDILDRVTAEIAAAAGSGLLRLTAFARAARVVDSSTANKILDNAIGRGAFKQTIQGGQAWLKLPP